MEQLVGDGGAGLAGWTVESVSGQRGVVAVATEDLESVTSSVVVHLCWLGCRVVFGVVVVSLRAVAPLPPRLRCLV